MRSGAPRENKWWRGLFVREIYTAPDYLHISDISGISHEIRYDTNGESVVTTKNATKAKKRHLSELKSTF